MSGAKPRAFSDEGGGKRHSATSTASDGVAGGGGRLQVHPSPPKVRRGLPPSQASLKILQAATGIAVIPSATTPTQDKDKQQQQQPDRPPEAEAQSSGQDPAASVVNTTAGAESPSSGRAARVAEDLESSGGQHQDGQAADAATPKRARI